MRKMLQFEKSSVIKWPSRWQLFEKLTRSAMIIALLTFIVLPLSWAQTEAIHRLIEPKPNVAASSLSSYLERVRAENSNLQPAPGSIWIDSGRLTRINTDVRAMRPHDLISVVVSENLEASTDGTVKNSRASNASSAISGLIGTLHAGNALQNLINQTSSSGLNAQGTSATNSSLSTTFGGQVIEVLSNGMLVIEAARQVEFSQQTQTIVLRGLVRPEDISQQNLVSSLKYVERELSTTIRIVRIPSFVFYKKC
jgi:flagellar L-ring protein precursor FlgH